MIRAQQQLFDAINKRGPCESLFRLAVSELGISYVHAWRVANQLEQAGKITIQRRGPGRPLILSVTSRNGE